MAIKAFTKKDDGVLIQQPVYYPFSEVITDNGRKIVSNDLVYGDDSRYHIDIVDFEKKIVDKNIKLFLLCNPHNPGGRVWTVDELRQMGDICVKHGVTVVSDEIHEDFVFSGRHTVFANICEDFAQISITCTSPSKTFNLASMMISNIFIPNPRLKAKFRRQRDAAGISQLSILGLTACQAAYENGKEWYLAMKKYVASNIEFTQKFVDEQLSGVNMTQHEGTYLIWLDFRGTGLSYEELDDRIINKARLWLDSGNIFGDIGKGFQRINVACPRKTLEEALNRIKNTL